MGRRTGHWVASLTAAWLLCVPAPAMAQPVAEQDIAGIERERARLDQQRQQDDQRFDSLEAACAGRFDVNRCLKSVQAERLVAARLIRQREQQLSELERRRAASRQQQSSAERQAEWLKKEQERDTANLQAQAREKQQAQEEKQAEHRRKQEKGPEATGPVASPKTAGPDLQTQAANRDAYAKKVESAERRRQERDQRLKEKGGPSVALPLPP